MKLDVSPSGVTNLSDYTLSRLHALDEDVLLYPVYTSGYDSTVRDLVTETLNKMSAECAHVHVETIDPVTQPQRIAALSGDTGSIENGTVFITNQDATRIIRLSPEEFLFSRTVLGEEYTIYCGEAQLIGAIGRACTDNPVGVYFLTGHGELTQEDCSLLALQLRSNGFEVHSGEIARIAPAATDILLLLAPRSDLTGDEAQTLARARREIFGRALRKDECLGDVGLRVCEHIADVADLGDAALVDDSHALADLFDDAHLVRDDDDRHAERLVDLLKQA